MEAIQAHLVNQIIENFPKFFDKSSTEIKKLLSEITEEYTIKINDRESDIEDLIEKISLFLNGKEVEGLSKKTLKGYKYELNNFAKYTQKKTHQINSNDIRNFLSSKESLKRSTIIKKLQVLKSFFGWLSDEEIIGSNPAKRVKSPRPEQRINSFFSIKELEQLRDGCKSLRSRAIIEMFYATGCRVSEIAGMKKSDVDMKNMSITVIGKGNKERIVYFNERALHHLEKYLDYRRDSCDYLFVTQRKPFRDMRTCSIQKELRGTVKASNLNRNVTCHDFRRSLATHAINSNVDVAVIQQLLGHSNVSSTLIYTKLSEQRKESEYRRFMSQ